MEDFKTKIKEQRKKLLDPFPVIVMSVLTAIVSIVCFNYGSLFGFISAIISLITLTVGLVTLFENYKKLLSLQKSQYEEELFVKFVDELFEAVQKKQIEFSNREIMDKFKVAGIEL